MSLDPCSQTVLEMGVWLEKGWIIPHIWDGEVTPKLWLAAAGLILSTLGLFISITMQIHNALETLGLLSDFMQLVTSVVKNWAQIIPWTCSVLSSGLQAAGAIEISVQTEADTWFRAATQTD